MDFAEATRALKYGSSIRRKSWPPFFHLKIIEHKDDKGDTFKVITGYRQEAIPFIYDSGIIISDDWIVVDVDDNLIDFPAAIEKLRQRYKVRLKSWPKNTYLELSENSKNLVMRRMCEHDYVPTFECFSADNWEIME